MYYYGLYLCCHHNAEANGKCLYFCFFEFLSKIFIHRGHHLTSLGSWGPAFSFSWGYGSCFLKAAFSFTSAVFMFEFLVAGKSSIPTSQLERERQCSKLLSSFWMWKENYISLPSGRWRAGCRRGCVTAAAGSTLLRASRCREKCWLL